MNRFLGRCPRLSHCAALRQSANNLTGPTGRQVRILIASPASSAEFLSEKQNYQRLLSRVVIRKLDFSAPFHTIMLCPRSAFYNHAVSPFGFSPFGFRSALPVRLSLGYTSAAITAGGFRGQTLRAASGAAEQAVEVLNQVEPAALGESGLHLLLKYRAYPVGARRLLETLYTGS